MSLHLPPRSLANRHPMALKPTIYKFKIALSDMDRDVYDTFNLTIALHPSETLERMMARVMAFCFNADEQLVFCKGLSDSDEPDLWQHGLDGQLTLWIEVGEPITNRIKKATRMAPVKVYCFNNKANTWWDLNQQDIGQLSASIYQLQWPQMQALAKLVDRTVDASVTITDGTAYVATEQGECEVSVQQLQSI